ncbi:PBECR3 domain-containing polyvalent protein, partial [Helicobacter cynogastricus]
KLDPNTPYTGDISYNEFKAQLKEQGLLAEAKPFLKFIESNVYNKEGVSFTQLENARKLLNSYYKEAQNPNLRDHIQRGLENFLREDIKAGSSQLFKELPAQMGSKYEQLFNTALKDYALSKQTLKQVKKLRLRDVASSQEQALDALIKFAKGQGEEGLDNFSKLTKGLSAQNKEVLELNMLHRIFQRSLIGEEDLKVFDSAQFFEKLGKLTQGTFSSKGAKDFIEIAQGFHRLFNQDANILRSLKPTTGGKIGSSIATSVSGAMQFQVTKALFDLVVRTAPYIPFAKVLNDKVSGAALRHHIKSALHKSYSVAEFKQHLRALGQRVEFDNATKALIREIERGLPPDDPPPGGGGGGGGGGIPSPKDTPISGGGNKPPKGNDEKTLKEGNGELISKTTPTRKATKEDLTEEFLEEVKRRKNDKVWVGDLTNPKIIEHLGFDPNKPIKMLFDGDALTHIEKRHGKGSPLVEESKQPAVTREDIATYPEIVNGADLIRVDKDRGRTVLIIGKQINGYMVVVEIVGKKYNLLSLKTIYKENGKLENGLAFKDGAGIQLSKF